MSVTPAQHATHTAGIQKTRSSFGLGPVKTVASAIGNTVKRGVQNVEANVNYFKNDIAKNGINPFGLKDIARGNVKP